MVDSESGLWRFEDLLVVDRKQPIRSDRCVWTNEPAGAEPTLVEFGGPTEAHTYERFKLAVPTSETWKGASQMAKRRIGRLIFRPAAAVCVSGILLVVIVTSSLDQQATLAIPLAVIGMAGMSLGGIIASIGLCWPYLDGVPGSGGTITAVRVDPGYVFVRGAHPEFLAGLSAWQGASPDRAPAGIQWYFAYVTAAIGVFLLVGGAVSFLFFGWSWWGAAGSLDWPTTTGVVTRSVVEESRVYQRRRGMVTVQTAKIEFAYPVEGERYTSRRVSYLGAHSGSASAAVSRYPVGTEVQVYYRPGNPSHGVLEPGVDSQMKLFTIGGLLATLLAGPVLLFARNQFRQLRKLVQLAKTIRA
jgi:hypothetical protein